MNKARYMQDKKVFILYYDYLHTDNTKKLLEFLEVYVSTYENDNSLYKCATLSSNPLQDIMEDFEEISQYYNMIRLEINKHTVNPQIDHIKKTHLAKLLAYAGVIYEYGLFGITSSKQLAFKHYKQSAQLNCPYGTFRLAQCYEKGNGVPKNLKQALSFYRCAAKLGSIEALHTFGTILLQNNLTGDYSEEMGIVYLRLAAKKASKNYPFACYDYSRYVEYNMSLGIGFFDISYCFQSYLKGAFLECPNCQYKIGEVYEKGEMGVESSLTEAIMWYRKAAVNGHSEAQLKIADFLLKKNEFYPEDFELAYSYALKSAVSENCKAAKYVSLLFEKGIGIKRNLHLSKWWNLIFKVYCKYQKISFTDESFKVFEKLVNKRRPTDDIKVHPILTSNALKVV